MPTIPMARMRGCNSACPGVLDRVGCALLAVRVRYSLADVLIAQLRRGLPADEGQPSGRVLVAGEVLRCSREPVLCDERADDEPALRGEDDLRLHRLLAVDLPGVSCGLIERCLGGAAIDTDKDGLVPEVGGRGRVAMDDLAGVHGSVFA